MLCLHQSGMAHVMLVLFSLLLIQSIVFAVFLSFSPSLDSDPRSLRKHALLPPLHHGACVFVFFARGILSSWFLLFTLTQPHCFLLLRSTTWHPSCPRVSPECNLNHTRYIQQTHPLSPSQPRLLYLDASLHEPQIYITRFST